MLYRVLKAYNGNEPGDQVEFDTPAGEALSKAGILELVDEETETAEPGSGQLADAVDGLQKQVAQIATALEKQNDPPQRPAFAAPGIREGENTMSSRGYSVSRLCRALDMQRRNKSGWDKHARLELDLANRLGGAYRQLGLNQISTAVPLGSDIMPVNDMKTEDGRTLPGLGEDLVSECRQVMCAGIHGFDPGELDYQARQHGAIAGSAIYRDMSAGTSNTGGVLVAAAAQGELIELLRAMEVFSRAGATEITLPNQGAIRFARSTGSITIAATSEAATVAESTPTFGELVLQAKPYSGLVDVPQELMEFSSIAIEAWIRSEFAQQISRQADSDMVQGAGGKAIQGVINYSGISVVIATTTGANGDTLEAEDPARLVADMADNNAPVDRGVFFSSTNTLWTALINRQDSNGQFMFSRAINQASGGAAPAKNLDGHNVYCSTHIPTDRVKGSGTDLTLLLAGVGAEWVIGRVGILSVDMTNSDASKFQQRMSTFLGTQFVDSGPRHEESFGMIDDVTNS